MMMMMMIDGRDDDGGECIVPKTVVCPIYRFKFIYLDKDIYYKKAKLNLNIKNVIRAAFSNLVDFIGCSPCS